ncbi:alpha/beta fold hydrolase [Brevibacterium marinum]|uniref:Pimeloyl-ACP methyl ester carboxylesterase n=1 Tax=Brevibacterium marinum TaxID=418643 RepID=A0A846S1Y5_9MICO|nr:alpha/beta fold hydrolase [Brevibacterium marinum]NJC58166.1 pimeloyl-ACP methyl ester carboxylesterase [Brevibacterium marinum]
MSSHDYNRYRVSVSGGELSVGVWEPVAYGPGRVPTVCVIHGITSNHLFFAGLVSALPGVRIIGPDLRGRADSRLLGPPFGMRAHAEDVLTAINAFAEPGPVTLVGHSMGGFVAMTLAGLGAGAEPGAEVADRFRGPVLIDGGLPLPVPDTEGEDDAEAPDDLNDRDLDTDDLIAAVLGPAADRLSMSFGSVEEYLAFFAAHPAFVDGLDTVAAESFVYDLAAKDDHSFQPSTSIEAMQADAADMYTGDAYQSSLAQVMGSRRRQSEVTFLVAERDLVASEPGLYPPDLVDSYRQRWEAMDVVDVPGTNHFDIVLSEAGIDACAEAVMVRLGVADDGALN